MKHILFRMFQVVSAFGAQQADVHSLMVKC
jgi:hypothetical protein